MNKLIKLITFSIFLFCGHIYSQCTLASGASVSQIQTAINSAASNACPGPASNIANFSSGSYSNGGSQVNVPCPTSAGMIVQGPVATYARPTSLLPSSYSYTSPYTANLNNSITNNFGWVVGSNGCTNPITIRYFNWNGGQPSGGGGGWIDIVGGESNLTITDNYIHGNTTPVGTAGTPNLTFSHEYDDLISFQGVGFSQFPINSNVSITWNIFGNGTSDCNSVMNLIHYGATDNNGALAFYASSGGYCGGIGVHASTTNLVVQNNDFEHLEQPMKLFQGDGCSNTQCPGVIARTFMLNNPLIDKNDYGQWHRIALEGQQTVVQNNSTGGVATFSNNSMHDPIDPEYAMFGFSIPMCCSGYSGYTTNDNQVNCNSNTMVDNVPTPNFTSYAFEWWSTGNCSNNLMQGYWNQNNSSGGGNGIGWGETNTAVRHWFANNNTCQFKLSGGVCIGQEVEPGNPPAPNQLGNITTTTIASVASIAPTIFPSAGSQSFPLVVTLNDPGYTSGALPQGNTGIWYTIDGSNPIPGSGTAKRLDNGGTFTLLSAATVKAVGLWGALNQPITYPSGNYGWTPSSIVSTTYTSTASPIFNCTAFTSSGTCSVGGTSQSFWLGGTGSGSLSGSQVILVPTGSTHAAINMNYTTAVNVQAFTSTFTFVPNGWNLAFVLQNNTNINAGGGGNPQTFSSGAGCEGAFYQGFASFPPWPNDIFALNLDSSNFLDSGSSFYSNAQVYQQAQSPCNPNDGQTYFFLTNKNSTSPIPLTSPTTTPNTTTGDTYSATATYDGTTFTLNMYDITAGGSCPGTSCFTKSWNVINIPSLVGSNTAFVGLAGGTNAASTVPLIIKSFTYSVGSVPSIPSASTYTTTATAGANFATSPVFSPAGGNYTGTQNVTLSNSTTNSYFCYILSATTPVLFPQTNNAGGCIIGTLYSGPISISSNQTLYAMAGTPAGIGLPSALTVGTYTIGSGPTLQTITLASTGGTTTFNPGQTNQLIATGHYSDSSTANISSSANFSSSTPGVGTVTSPGGFYTAGSTANTTNITASLGAISTTTPLVLTTTAVTPTITGGFIDNPTNTNTIAIGGGTLSFTAHANYSDGQTRSLPDSFGNTANWSIIPGSSTCGTVNSSGVFTPTTTGTCNVRATASPGGNIFSPWGMTVTAQVVTLQSITLTATGGITSVTTGSSVQLIATGNYSDSSHVVITGSITAWATSDGTKATISSGGVVTGVAAGNPTFIATMSGITSTPAFPLTIIAGITLQSIIVTTIPASVNIMLLNWTLPFDAHCLYSNGDNFDCVNTDGHGNAVTWTSSNTLAATFTNNILKEISAIHGNGFVTASAASVNSLNYNLTYASAGPLIFSMSGINFKFSGTSISISYK